MDVNYIESPEYNIFLYSGDLIHMIAILNIYVVICQEVSQFDMGSNFPYTIQKLNENSLYIYFHLNFFIYTGKVLFLQGIDVFEVKTIRHIMNHLYLQSLN